MKFAKGSSLVSLVLVLLVSACGPAEDSTVSNSDKKSYRLRCLANIGTEGNVYTMRAEGTKDYKMKKPVLIDPRKERDEYFKVLTDLQSKCNGNYANINASGCGQIKNFQHELLKQDPRDPAYSIFLPIEYTAVGKKYKGEYFCVMVEAAPR